MSIVVAIDGREAIPIRAIPFVTGWTMSPDEVAATLAHTDLTCMLKKISAYHLLADGRHAAMLPKEWDGIEAALKTLSDKLKAQESFTDENYPTWLRESIPLLQFSRAYFRHHRAIIGERPGDRDLTMEPKIPADVGVALIVEGFLSQKTPKQAPSAATFVHEATGGPISATHNSRSGIPYQRAKTILSERFEALTDAEIAMWVETETGRTELAKFGPGDLNVRNLLLLTRIVRCRRSLTILRRYFMRPRLGLQITSLQLLRCFRIVILTKRRFARTCRSSVD